MGHFGPQLIRDDFKAKSALKLERCSDLVSTGTFVEILRIQTRTDTKSETPAKLYVICESGDALVIDFGLSHRSQPPALKQYFQVAYLGKRSRIQPVLCSQFKTDIVASLRVPHSFGTRLNLGVDLMVVRGGKYTQAVGGCDSSTPLRCAIPDRSSILGDRSLLNIVASFNADQETLMTKNGIDVGSRALEQVEEGAAGEILLLEMEVEFRGDIFVDWFEILRM